MVVKKITSTVYPLPCTYEIVMGRGVLRNILKEAEKRYSRTLLITTPFLDKITAFQMEKLLISDGEQNKTREMKSLIEEELIKKGWGREGCLLALGGGTLLDLAGFAAATYCRGVAYWSLPTTLLAMTDAALGGKTGVNVKEAKNWIGAFHHPERVVCDLDLLDTLPDQEFLFGLAETIKHALIADASLFVFLEKHYEGILKREPHLLEELVWRSCTIKKGIVEQDPYEKRGERKILNFGHTVGHALEAFSGYSLPHGLAVARGMYMESVFAYRMGYLSFHTLERIEVLLHNFGFVLDFIENLPYEFLKRDKKGEHHFVVLTEIGTVAPFGGKYTTVLSQTCFKEGWEYALCHNPV